MARTTPTLAIFDLDGTLVDSAPDIAAALNRLMARQHLAPFDLAEVTAMIGDGARALVEKALTLRAAPIEEAAIAAFLEDLEANSAALTRPYPGMVPVLETLTAQGWTLAICTNKPMAPTTALLNSLGLAHHFALVLGGDSLSMRKPDPRHVLAVLERLDMRPAWAVMIGDHRNDIQAALGAGVRSIFAAWGYGEGTGADASAASPAGLIPLLEPLRRK